MISRRSFRYSSMMRRASSVREGLGFGSGAFPCGPGSSDGLMVGGSPENHRCLLTNIKEGSGPVPAIWYE
jgi:hypothetical protein